MLLPERSLYLLFTPELCTDDPWDTLARALAGGVDLVQWRAEQGTHDDFHRCRRACRDANVPVIVNDDVMLAVHGHAAGAHVGQDDIPADAARRLLDQDLTTRRILGVSTHDPGQITRAIAAGADYVGFGPCYPTATKGYAEGLPAAAVAAACEAAGETPLFAIGGITAANLPALRGRGVDRIAVSSAILASDDPRAAAAELRQLLGKLY